MKNILEVPRGNIYTQHHLSCIGFSGWQQGGSHRLGFRRLPSHCPSLRLVGYCRETKTILLNVWYKIFYQKVKCMKNIGRKIQVTHVIIISNETHCISGDPLNSCPTLQPCLWACHHHWDCMMPNSNLKVCVMQLPTCFNKTRV